MPTTLSPEDYRFISRVEELASREGRSASEIAAELGLGSRAALRYRLHTLGFTLRPVVEVRTALTGEPLRDLISRGEVVSA